MPSNTPFDILYEDDSLIAVSKPPGLLVESAGGDEPSLLDMIVSRHGPKVRACHRLDRLTTGVVLFSKSRLMDKEIARLFEKKRIRKEYWAVVEGEWPRDCNRVETRIASLGNGVWKNVKEGGKAAISTFRVLKRNTSYTCLQVLPKTGRTHQIRLHCQSVGNPILGDPIYGKVPETSSRLALHARSIRFLHPILDEQIEIIATAPDYWQTWLDVISS